MKESENGVSRKGAKGAKAKGVPFEISNGRLENVRDKFSHFAV
jgi:hypothetical protein